MASKDLPPFKESFNTIFLRSQFKVKSKPPPQSTSLAGQTVIITGSNTGIGLECARILVNFHLSHLIVAVRDVQKGENAISSLRKTHPDVRIEVWTLDMLSYDSICAFAERCATSLSRLDIAILNAGVVPGMNVILNKPTGHEVTIQVNCISTALLSILLLPILKTKSPVNTPGRLTIVASGVGLFSKFPNHAAVPLLPSFDDDSKPFTADQSQERYFVSKTLTYIILSKLSETVSPEDVVINAVDPGLTKGTDLHRDLPFPYRQIFSFVKWVTGRTLQQAAWTYVDAAVVKGQETHGSFLMDWKICPFHPLLYTPEGKQTTEQLWGELMEEFKFAKVEEIVASMGGAGQSMTTV